MCIRDSFRFGCPNSHGQHASDQEYSSWNRRALRRNEAWKGCSDRSFRGRIGPVPWARTCLCAYAPSVGRNPKNIGRVSRYHRRSRQFRKLAAEVRKSRCQALEGNSTHRPWCRHESSRPPPWWRRRANLRRASSGEPNRGSDQGFPYP